VVVKATKCHTCLAHHQHVKKKKASEFLYTCVGIIGLDFYYLMENLIGSPASVEGSNESIFFSKAKEKKLEQSK
jgi:hypothetical protein